MHYYESLVEGFLQADSALNGGRAAALWPSILHLCYPALAASNLVRSLVSLIMRGIRNQCSGGQLHHFAEVFCGAGHLSRELLREGFSGTAFDYMIDSAHNFLDADGLRCLLDCVTAVRKRGLVWLGTPCSSFVVLCRCQSMRNASNEWLGDSGRGFVQIGNALAEVSALVFFLCYALSVWVVLEQPQSSCLPKMPSMNGVLHYCRAMRFVTYMGQYGGDSMKPLQIWSTWQQMQDLEVGRPSSGGGQSLVARNGNAFTGVKSLLEASQVYTPCFGRQVTRICRAEWS